MQCSCAIKLVGRGAKPVHQPCPECAELYPCCLHPWPCTSHPPPAPAPADGKLQKLFPGTRTNMFKLQKLLSKHCKTSGAWAGRAAPAQAACAALLCVCGGVRLAGPCCGASSPASTGWHEFCRRASHRRRGPLCLTAAPVHALPARPVQMWWAAMRRRRMARRRSLR